MARVMNPGGPHLDASPCPARSAAKPAGWRAFSGRRQATLAPVCARAPCTRPTARALLRVANFRCPFVVPKSASNEHPTPPRSHAGPPETRRRDSPSTSRRARAPFFSLSPAAAVRSAIHQCEVLVTRRPLRAPACAHTDAGSLARALLRVCVARGAVAFVARAASRGFARFAIARVSSRRGLRRRLRLVEREVAHDGEHELGRLDADLVERAECDAVEQHVEALDRVGLHFERADLRSGGGGAGGCWGRWSGASRGCYCCREGKEGDRRPKATRTLPSGVGGGRARSPDLRRRPHEPGRPKRMRLAHVLGDRVEPVAGARSWAG